jgi:hypothetical protein
MSNAGLHSNLYRYARDLSELVDTVLVELKTSRNYATPKQKELGNILISVADAQWNNYTDRLLSLTLEDIGDVKLSDWLSVGQSLLTQSADTQKVRLLERLARTLEQEQVEAAARFSR